MANSVILSARDLALLKLLSWTPATTPLLLRASVAFASEPFTDERRLRERLQALSDAGFVRSWSTAHAGGGLQNYYKLTPTGFERFYGSEAQKPPRAFFVEISPALFEHTLRLAETITETLRACAQARISVVRFFRENELTFTVGKESVQPDCFWRLSYGGKPFNIAFEIDQSTESLDTNAGNSIRTKLRIYDAYQETLLANWRDAGKAWERPRFRVAFLTRSIDRAYHILALARDLAAVKSRHLVLGATEEFYVGDSDPVRSPLFVNHDGHFQSLVDLHPTAGFMRPPIRIPTKMEHSSPLW
jgi:hypothetical protein